jgi:hypothetical protein
VFPQILVQTCIVDAGKKGVEPDAPKAVGNDATPVDDVETAYQAYAEEISQAWKTRR